jgi:hypothetical protein
VKATEAIEVSRANELLRQARGRLLQADCASDLRTALSCVREALDITTRLSETLRQLTTPAAVEATQDAQEREDRFSRPARGFRGG